MVPNKENNVVKVDDSSIVIANFSLLGSLPVGFINVRFVARKIYFSVPAYTRSSERYCNPEAHTPHQFRPASA